jgi:hypothetical protein
LPEFFDTPQATSPYYTWFIGKTVKENLISIVNDSGKATVLPDGKEIRLRHTDPLMTFFDVYIDHAEYRQYQQTVVKTMETIYNLGILPNWAMGT